MSITGKIRGGSHDGWHYAFVKFVLDSRAKIRIQLIASEPDWPFPQPITLAPGDFNKLEPVKGERAKRIDTAPLIAEARTQLPLPSLVKAVRRRIEVVDDQQLCLETT